MVPSVFFPISTIPLSPTGKTDLRRLQAEVATLTRSEIETYNSSVGPAPKRSPSSDNEIILHRLLTKALALPNKNDISLEDNFFSVGGDSLTAMKLANLASKEGFQLSVTDIFQYPVLSDLARAIQDLNKPTDSPPKPFSLLTNDTAEDALDLAAEICSIPRAEIEDIYPCSPRQENQIAMAEERPGMLYAQYEYEIPSHLRPDQLRKIWQTVLDQNPILRTRIIHTLGGTTVQVVQKASTIDWHYGDCLRRYLKEDVSQLMGLGKPLARFALVEEPGMSYFVLTFHHALYDGWSIPLLMRQVESAYHGRSVRVEPFTGFIRYCLSLEAEATQKFWTSEFSNLKAVPFPDPRNATTSSKIEERMTVNRTITIPRIAHANITLVNIIKLAWSVVVSAYTDSEDVVFGLTTSGRDAPVSNIDLMTGPTFATVPFRVRILPKQSVQDALLSIQRSAAEMVTFKHTGLQAIRKMNADTELACNFQTHLIFQVTEHEASPELGLLRRRAPEKLDLARFARDALHVDFFVSPKGNEVNTTMTFDPLALPTQQASQFLFQFEHVLHQVCAGAIQLIGDAELVSPDDMTRLQKWDDRRPVSRTPTMSELNLSPASNGQGQTAVGTLFKHNSQTGMIYPMMGCTSWVTLPSDPSRLAPLGAVGELLIEGPIEARRNLDDLGRTSALYVDPPHFIRQFRAPGRSSQLYRSGDLVRVTGDGSIKFFGRKHTEKHLGRQIELNRVERHIQPLLTTGQQVIADVVVLNGHGKSQSTALVAFVEYGGNTVVSNRNEDKSNDGCNFLVWPDKLQFLSEMSIVRDQLRAYLPSFMIPVAFVPVRRIPLTPGGEIDRLALREATSCLDMQEYIPIVTRKHPTTEDERQIIRLIAEVLGLPSDKIGLQDNFFDMGGDSLKAMLLCTKARTSGLRITVADIYENQPLQELASRVTVGMGTQM
ncbi:hypothetical protein N7537_005366 [Penicillium hordei]|uniref:Carrier domain-containing protein n=1 Tax=Penicillium hordei TaxID=40994 RepID=A0AAD6H3E2_9EURO|nr:uncharacterized protein N7537_005366 [Penicillium hordei]KAJ5602410.1 hypothetical protein N7537_005366 [Penicillium hordei]